MHVRSFRSLVLTLGASSLAAVTLLACGSTATEKATKDAGQLTLNLPPTLTFDGGAKKDVAAPDASKHDASVDTGVVGVDAPAPPTDAELNTFPAFKPNVPQVQNGGGPVLSSPVFIPVIFAGDGFASQITPFLDAIGQSAYWKGAVAEYGIGAGTAAPPIVLDETFPDSIDDSQLQTWLANKVGLDPRFGALGASVFDAGAFDAGSIDASAPLSPSIPATAVAPAGAIYVLFLPNNTSVTLEGTASCVSGGFGGYHNSFYMPMPNGSTVVYATIPRCGAVGPSSAFQELTGTVSHELAEASTDPEVGAGGGGQGGHIAWGYLDTNHLFWGQVLGGEEVGDLCAQFPGAFYNPSEPAMSMYTVQRIWSNKAASAGEDPCQPAQSLQAEPYYFNSVPKLAEVAAQEFGQNLTTLGVSVPVGSSSTIELDLFSNISTAGVGWNVSALDANALSGGAPDLTFSPGVVTGTNGDKLQLTVTNAGNDGRSVHPFIIQSTSGVLQNWWIGVVTD